MVAPYRPPPASALDIDLIVVSAKHLKNVNWRNGDLKPYAVFWIDPDRRLSTRSDDSGSTRPDDRSKIRTFSLLRPSGRPQGKIRVKLGIRERPLPPTPYYHYAPSSYYYTNTPPPPHPPRYPASPYISLPQTPPYSSIQNAYPPHYSSHYYTSTPQPMPPRPFLERSCSYGGPSAPLDYSPYDHRPRGVSRQGTGLAVGAAAASLGGLTLEEGMRFEEEKISQRVEHDVSSRERDDYSDYRHPDY
ncbi:Detected protein of unknown function [Hibiscus syriacus]|uniref:Uncharacterized protein n=1 Tax=Hibiscus syriacus TaxID=106335 RepID=A0A6A2XUU7_HIBSY|nr:Detected protein of unknown function [Hibiscus syriacus]